MYEENNRKIFTSNVILLILKLLLLAIFIFILCWLFISNRGQKKKTNEIDSEFVTNINVMKDTALEYFTTDKLPNTIGEAKKVTLKQMLDDKLLLDFTNNGKECNLDESYIEATKTSDNKYAVKVNLSCKKATDFIVTSLEKEEVTCPICQNNQNQPTTNVTPTEDKNDEPNPNVTNTPNNNSNNSNNNSNTTTKPKEEKTVYKYYYFPSNTNTTTTKNTMYEIYTYGKWNEGYQSGNDFENTCSNQNTYEYCKVGSLTRYVSYYLSDAFDNREYSTKLYLTKLDYKSIKPYETTSSYFTSSADYDAFIKQLNEDRDEGRNFIKNAKEMMVASLGAQNFTFKTSDVYQNGIYFKIDLTININNHNNVKPLYTDYFKQNIYFAPVKFTVKYKLINSCVNDTLANMNNYKNYKMFDSSSNECKNRQKITKWVSAKELYSYLENGWLRTGNVKEETI